MNSRQCKKKLKRSLLHDYEIKGRKIYSYKTVHNNSITLVFTASFRRGITNETKNIKENRTSYIE